MNTLMHWFNMGGYAGYVWSAYGIVGVVLSVHMVGIFWKKKQVKKRLQQRLHYETRA